MKPKVYIETTVISYLTAWPSRDVVMHGHQQATREWWLKCPDRYDLFTSAYVLREAKGGDANAALERLNVLATIPLLEAGTDTLALAERLITEGALPEKARVDALHIAVAVTNGMDFLVTWNCKHIANAALWSRIKACCQDAGYDPVLICTPIELMEE